MGWGLGLAIILFCSIGTAAEGDTTVQPPYFRSKTIREGAVKYMIWFSGNASLVTGATGVPPASLSTPELTTIPRGIGAFWDTMCTYPCVSIVNSSCVLVTLNQASEYDTSAREEISFSFERAMFTDRVARKVSIVILPDQVEASGLSIGASVTFQLMALATAITMPAMVDVQLVALFVQQPCTTEFQRAWMPFAPYLSFLMAGSGVFDRSWRVVAMVGGGLFIIVGAIGLFPKQLHSRTVARTVLPLALIQIVNLWLPPLMFASTHLLSYGSPAYQVWGAFLCAGVGGLSVIAGCQIFADRAIIFVPGPEVRAVASLRHLATQLISSSGKWLAPRYAYMYESTGILYLRHVNRFLLPFYFSGRPLRKHMLFIAGNTLLLAGVGIQARSPNGCLVQGWAIVSYILVSSFCVFLLGFKIFGVKILTIVIRLIVGAQLCALVAVPSDSFAALFAIMTLIGAILGWVRVVAVIADIARDGVSSICTEPLEENSQELLPKKPRRPKCLSDLPNIVELDTDDSGGSEYDLPDDSFAVVRPMRDSDEREPDNDRPAWMQKGTLMKPKAPKEDTLAAPTAMWYPAERPDVRTTNEADTELDLSPYTVRMTRKKLHL